jgi:enoyl-CoA hydratase/carnithine racemase
MLTSTCLLIEKEAPLAWLKINRPASANALNKELLESIFAATEEIAADNQIRVVAIIGAGRKFFSAGADLTERRQMTEAQLIDYHLLIQKTMQAVEWLPQPVIAAINGSAYGGGTELALACDLRVMVKSTSLSLPEVKLGIIPGAGGTQRLPRLIGKSKAKEMIFTGAPLSAEEGYQHGLINKLVDESGNDTEPFHQPLMQFVKSWAQEIAMAAPLSLRQAKLAIDSGFDKNLADGLALETKAYLRLINTKDRLEGLAAFAEKRKPTYIGE